MFSEFSEIFTELYDKNFPIKSKALNYKDIRSPWVTDTLLLKIDNRDELSKAADKNRISKDVFRKYRNKLKTELRKAKAKYYENEFKKNSNNLKKTWSIINDVLKPKLTNKTVNLIDDQGNNFKEQTVPIKFVDYFTSIAENLTSQLPSSNANPEDYLTNRIPNTFVFLPTTEKEVSDVINDLKDNGSGVHKISNSVLKHVNKELSPILAQIINICVDQGYYPTELKKGCITPIFKNGKKNLVNNYRPVCSLSPLSKIIEKVVYNKMINFIDKYGILTKEQYGFRKTWALIMLLEIMLIP